MTTIQPSELWERSGRINAYGPELLRFKDRRNCDLLYSPTNEEQITNVFKNFVQSYKILPQNLYQIQWKFRDEIRPRFGVMRGREFLMKDGYSFDIDVKSAHKTYADIFSAYMKTFRRMGLNVVPVAADSGPIGGNMNHEFQILAPNGESDIIFDGRILSEKANDIDSISKYYSSVIEKHTGPTDDYVCTKGIEVGHIFFFGTKYSTSMDLKLLDKNGEYFYPQMGSYGIGVGRVVAAIIESNHDKNGIKWPLSVTPFQLGLVNLKNTDCEIVNICEKIYSDIIDINIDVLYDDRQNSAGVQMSDMDLIGLPFVVICGKNTKNGTVDIKNRQNGNITTIPIESIQSYLLQTLSAA